MYFKVNTLLITNSSGKLAGKSTVSERLRPQGHHFPPQLIAQLPTNLADICCDWLTNQNTCYCVAVIGLVQDILLLT